MILTQCQVLWIWATSSSPLIFGSMSSPAASHNSNFQDWDQTWLSGGYHPDFRWAWAHHFETDWDSTSLCLALSRAEWPWCWLNFWCIQPLFSRLCHPRSIWILWDEIRSPKERLSYWTLKLSSLSGIHDEASSDRFGLRFLRWRRHKLKNRLIAQRLLYPLRSGLSPSFQCKYTLRSQLGQRLAGIPVSNLQPSAFCGCHTNSFCSSRGYRRLEELGSPSSIAKMLSRILPVKHSFWVDCPQDPGKKEMSIIQVRWS